MTTKNKFNAFFISFTHTRKTLKLPRRANFFIVTMIFRIEVLPNKLHWPIIWQSAMCVHLLQHGSAGRSAQRWETHSHRSSNICIAETQQTYKIGPILAISWQGWQNVGKFVNALPMLPMFCQHLCKSRN